MAAEIRIYSVGDSWALMPSAFGFFLNNGNVDLYIQQQKGDAPAANDAGARIRPGGSFFVSHELYKITYIRTLSGSTTIANYEDRNNGAGTTSIIDPVSGNAVAINATGQMHTVMRAATDTKNSTKVLLGANGVFLGESVELLDYAEITMSVYTDKDSAVDGLCLQFSSDGITYLPDGNAMSILGGKGKTFSFQPERRFYRVCYTNGAIAQTVFDLESTLHKTRGKPSSHNINKSIVSDDDAELVKSVITGMRDDGVFNNATLSNSNRLKVVAQQYGYAVAEGDMPGNTALFKFGTRSSVAAGVQSTIWEGPTALLSYLTSAQQLKLSSGSANDTALGTGARTLTLIGLDANLDEIEETVNMTGLIVVTTTKSYLRIFRAFVTTCGTSLTNEGTITVTNNAGTVTHLVVTATESQTLMTLWTVPRAKQLFITQLSTSTNSDKGARVSLYTRQLDGGTLYPWRIRFRAYTFSGAEIFPFNIPFVLPEKTDIQVRVTTPASAGTTSFGATFEGWYE